MFKSFFYDKLMFKSWTLSYRIRKTIKDNYHIYTVSYGKTDKKCRRYNFYIYVNHFFLTWSKSRWTYTFTWRKVHVLLLGTIRQVHCILWRLHHWTYENWAKKYSSNIERCKPITTKMKRNTSPKSYRCLCIAMRAPYHPPYIRCGIRLGDVGCCSSLTVADRNPWPSMMACFTRAGRRHPVPAGTHRRPPRPHRGTLGARGVLRDVSVKSPMFGVGN
jgi:hypothetical protein